MHKILISAPYMLRDREKIQKLLSPYPLQITWADVKERLEEADLLPIIGDFHGLICGDDRITPRVLDQAKLLKVIVKWGTGIDSINKPEAERRGIPVCRTPNAFTEPVADTTLAYILAFCRKVFENDLVLKNGGWDKPQGIALFERTVGLIGFGDIGVAVAKRLFGFGARVLAYDIVEKDAGLAAQLGVKFVKDKRELFEQSDFISLHCDLNSTSEHILNDEAFIQMPRKPYIINTARGPLIDEPALIDALQSGQVAGAGLDVFEHEPLPVSSPLRKMSNVILASHNSNNSPKCWDRVHENSIRMLLEKLGLQA